MMRNKKGASLSVKKAQKIEEQQQEEKNYKKIVGDDK